MKLNHCGANISFFLETTQILIPVRIRIRLGLWEKIIIILGVLEPICRTRNRRCV
jgi:hypothetical protein